MVKNRGIEVALISQFDIQRLPEFGLLPDPQTVETNLVSRYVPVYPGSQVWFEYTVEPPHPPGAAYYFKLLINGHPVTAWDCTEKHGYNGKMIYVLEKGLSGPDHSGSSLRRKVFKFRNQEDRTTAIEEITNDYMELRVYRIEHRRRIRESPPERDESPERYLGSKLELISSGFLEPGRPQRRYKYQLLDSADHPFAVFRFFHRTYDYLWQNNIIADPSARSCSTPSSSLVWYDASSASLANILGINGRPIEQGEDAGHQEQTVPSSPLEKVCETPLDAQQPSPTGFKVLNHDTYVPLSDSDESLSVIARDSVDDLQTTITRPVGGPQFECSGLRGGAQIFKSPIKQNLSPRQKLRKRLTLNFDDVEPNDRKEKRPLSPFTNGGLLRRLFSPELPPSAPTSIARPDLCLDNEVAEFDKPRRIGTAQVDPDIPGKTSSAERSGTTLMRLFSRRTARRKEEKTEDDENTKLSCS